MHVRKQLLPLPDRQIVEIADHRAVRDVVVGEPLLELQIVEVLNHLAGVWLEPRRQRIGIADELGPRVGRQNRPASAEALLDFHLTGVVDRITVHRRGDRHPIVLRKWPQKLAARYRRLRERAYSDLAEEWIG